MGNEGPQQVDQVHIGHWLGTLFGQLMVRFRVWVEFDLRRTKPLRSPNDVVSTSAVLCAKCCWRFQRIPSL